MRSSQCSDMGDIMGTNTPLQYNLLFDSVGKLGQRGMLEKAIELDSDDLKLNQMVLTE